MTLFLLLLFAGVIVALSRALAAEKRVHQLEDQIRAFEGRLRQVEAPNDPTSLATPQPPPYASPQPPPLPEVAPAASDAAPHPPAAIPVLPDVSAAAAAPGATTNDAESERTALEELIGGRWLLFAGIAAIVLGVSYFVKFAFDNGWISEPLRVAAGGATGFLLIAAGLRFRARGVPLFGQALAGAGIVVLYVSIYAALHFYGMIGEGAAFVLMAIVTAGAASLADRERSQPLAALALVGGFATPLLVDASLASQAVLFTYMALLISGAAAIARRHPWPLLGAASYACTFLLVIAWLFSSYRRDDWLNTELFLTLYVCLFAYLLRVVLREKSGRLAAQLAATVLATAPLAYHLASVLLLPPHPAAWLTYVVVVTLVALLLAPRLADGWLRLTALVLIGVPMLAWVGALPYPRWYAPAIVAVTAIYAMHLVAQWMVARDPEQRGAPLFIVYVQLNGLLLPATLYVFLDRHAAAWNPWMTGALAVWNAALATFAASWHRRLSVSFAALAATLAAATIVLAVDGPAVATGWAAEGVLLAWLAVRERSRTLAAGSAALLLLGYLQILSLLASPLPVGQLPVANPRAFAAALIIGMLAALVWFLRADRRPSVETGRTALVLLANVLLLALISTEIHAYFLQRAAEISQAGEPRLAADAARAEQVALSVSWALYAVALVFAGIRRRFAPARYLAILLFAIVVGKVLMIDIAGLDRLYRMLSVLGVGVLLLIASYLYQRTTTR